MVKKYAKTIVPRVLVLALCWPAGHASGQVQSPTTPKRPAQEPQVAKSVAPVAPTGVPLPAGYVIGPDDILTVLFWRDKEMSSEVAVRPDGMITLPLVNDVPAAGLTPEQLRQILTKAASKYLEDPNVTIVVKAINSRKVFIMGMVGKPGPNPLSAPTTVMQLLAIAGGVHEFAKSDEIIILRTEGGKQVPHRFKYNDVKKGKNLKQNIELKPGDTIIVP
jgi:polysaccharide export outer membrane protein